MMNEEMRPAAQVLICAPSLEQASTELAFAQRALLRELHGHAVCFAAQDAGSGRQAFARTWQQLGQALPAQAVVIFLAHGAVWPAPATLAALCAWAAQHDGLGVAADARLPGLAPTPDYLTLRGLEGYAQRLSTAMAGSRPEVAQDFEPLLMAVRAEVLRRQPEILLHGNLTLVAGAFVHDFRGYHQGGRPEMLRWIPEDCRSLLDVGGGEGFFLAQAKQERGCETHLAEFAPQACAAAQARVDRVWQGDFLQQDFSRRFDCISFLDVLEHTTWPVEWLRKARTLLNPGGTVLLSIPNVGHWSVVADLLAGRWDYTPAGIHCVTHVRFFTRTGILALVDEAGLQCEQVEAVVMPPPPWFAPADVAGELRCDRDSLASYAYHVRARLPGAAG